MKFDCDQRDPALLDSAILKEVNQAIAARLESLGITRREILRRGFAGVTAGALASLVACKERSESGLQQTSAAFKSSGSFLTDYSNAELNTPVPEISASDFRDRATKRGLAVASIISYWLSTAPYKMFQELLDQPSQQMPIFRPLFGPAIIFRHATVIKALEATDHLTVAPYASEMRKGTDGEHQGDLPKYFILGTDDDAQYRPDGMILRKAILPSDQETILRPMIRKICEGWVAKIKASGTSEFDAVTTLCRFVPVGIVSDYLGTPVFDQNQVSFDGKTKGGESFDLSTLKTVFKFQKIPHGTVPTPQLMYEWVRDAFRNIFNNFGGPVDQVDHFRKLGLIATENLTAWTQYCLQHYKAEIEAGRSVPDTMLTRLLKMQRKVNSDRKYDKEFTEELAEELKTSVEDLKKRLADGRIRANVFGTVTGGVVNPEEGSARMIDSILRLKDKEYKTLNGASYEHLAQAVAKDDPTTLVALEAYALEALRLQPQGEVLVRRCESDTFELAGQPILKGTLVFIAYASAMRDGGVVNDPLAFDIKRPTLEHAFEGSSDRKHEKPQSQLYLQHGYGRHKCLGRYASELTLQETLRALVSLGNISRGDELKMDENGLYAQSLKVRFV